MVVERYDNWSADRERNFSSLAFPGRYYKQLCSVKPGDRLIMYIASRISAFSDVREVVGEVQKRDARKQTFEYDSIFPLVVPTKPELVLPQDKWLPIRDVVSRLTFTRDLKDWRNTVRLALRPLSQEDGSLILSRMRRTEK